TPVSGGHRRALQRPKTPPLLAATPGLRQRWWLRARCQAGVAHGGLLPRPHARGRSKFRRHSFIALAVMAKKPGGGLATGGAPVKSTDDLLPSVRDRTPPPRFQRSPSPLPTAANDCPDIHLESEAAA